MTVVPLAHEAHTYRIGLLGPTTLAWNDLPLAMADWGTRPLSLLRLLAASRDGRRTRDEVADLLWPDSSPEAAFTNLRGTIHRLRTAVQPGPPPVALEGGWVQLNPACDWEIDLVRFEELSARTDLAALEEAASLLRGEPLVDDRYEDWAAPVRERIDQQWRSTCVRLIEGFRAEGEAERALAWAERLLGHDPLDESAAHQLLLLLDELGRRTEALQRYRAFAARLQAELDAPVAPETRALAEQIEEREHQARAEAVTLQGRTPPRIVPLRAGIEEIDQTAPTAIATGLQRLTLRGSVALALLPVLLIVAVVMALIVHPFSGAGSPTATASAAFIPVPGWATPHRASLSFERPAAIAVASGGSVIVSDQFAGRLDEISPAGTLVRQFQPPTEQPFLPTAVAVDHQGNVYAIDTGNASIRKFGPDGSLIATWPATAMTQGGTAPAGVAVDAHGRVYVAMQSNGQGTVAVLSSSGKPIPDVGTNSIGSFVDPLAVTSAPDGGLYVLDGGGRASLDQMTPAGTLAHSYDVPAVVSNSLSRASGTLSLSIAVDRHGGVYLATGSSAGGIAGIYHAAGRGSHGLGPWTPLPVQLHGFRNPSGIAVDDAGSVYATDAGTRRVVKLAADGRLLAIWGGSGAPPRSFDAPAGVAVDAHGNVYVADAIADDIVKLAPNGTVLDRWGGPGSGPGQFQAPQAVAVDSAGNIFVADMGNARVVKLSPTGAPIGPWGRAGSDTSQPTLAAPLSVAVDREGNVWVLDAGNGGVTEFSPAGKEVQVWQPATGDGGDYYGGLTVDGAGNVYVTDGLDSGVTKYTPSGRVIGAWGALGDLQGEFRSPAGIAVDGNGNIFVADTGNDRIQELSPRGSVIHVFGVAGSKPGQFAAPAGIALDRSGAVYVADTGNHRVQKLLPGRR